jgi:DNA mismatch repair protein MutS
MAQYSSFKRQYPDAVLFFHMGDFYETFGSDAELMARELGLTLTSRSRDREGRRIPLAGLPYHAAEGYITRLIARGYRVALCDQVEDPRQAKGVVRRDVVRVITPGTVIDAGMIGGADAHYLMAVAPVTHTLAGIALLEISTGEFFVTTCPLDQAYQDILSFAAQYRTPECIVSPSCPEQLRLVLSGLGIMVTPYREEAFNETSATRVLLEHFGVATLDGFGCTALAGAVSAAGAAISYAREMKKAPLIHVTTLSCIAGEERMVLDAVTLKNLEVLRGIRSGDEEGSLAAVLNRTITPMGSRSLKSTLTAPDLDPQKIVASLDAVEYFVTRTLARAEVRGALKACGDIERIAGRVAFGNASPRDLCHLAGTLSAVPLVRRALIEAESGGPHIISDLAGRLVEVPEVPDLISRALVDDPPLSVKAGGVIRDGFSSELDELRGITRSGKEWMAALQEQERESTGIRSLKVAYNSVFGYYLEVTKANLHLVPSHYERKQTTAGAERFTTIDLRERASQIESAEQRLLSLEAEVFGSVLDALKQWIPVVKELSLALGEVDRIAGLAEVAVEYSYCRPVIEDRPTLLVREGRHPVVERRMPGAFVPNDMVMDGAADQVLILTGANMAGKSTYMRTVALIAIMAQAGSFVPAAYARVGVVDRVFTRVGAFDDLASGQSTFMVEMVELATILNNVSGRSLVLLDEIGRGTSTLDGYAIATAVLEFLHGKGSTGPRTLFATHFHELVDATSSLPRAKSYHFAVRERGGDLIFLRTLVPGATDRSYGIHVARLAGIPKKVTERAAILLQAEASRSTHPGVKVKRYTQMLLPGDAPSSTAETAFVTAVSGLEPDAMTPMEALSRMYELRDQAKLVATRGAGKISSPGAE